MRHFVFLIAIFVSLIPDLRAGEPFFKPNDVVALVGGEDMVVAAELGYLETLIQLALPDHHLKFRSLAREGDTVFEQRRDLNYPKLEDQLDKIGATVVICQFGQMESLAVSEKIGDFVAAYEKLIGRLKGKGGARRVALLIPFYYSPIPGLSPEEDPNPKLPLRSIYAATIELAKISNVRCLNACANGFDGNPGTPTRDGVHYGELAHRIWATLAASDFTDSRKEFQLPVEVTNPPDVPTKLAALVAAKNRLWYYYYRPQNWAFLAGDRTNQPSSRDHLDPSKRWFPEELEKFVPLIDAKDAEIWALAKKLSGGGKN